MTDLELAPYGIYEYELEGLDTNDGVVYSQEIGTSAPFTFAVNTGNNSLGTAIGKTFGEQAGYQHHFSYPTQLDVTAVLPILAKYND